MRRKLLFIISVLCLMAVLVSGYVIYSIGKATRNFNDLVELHKVADMREQMLHQIEIVQDDLHLKQTRYARDLAQLVSHVSNMTSAIESCFDCHHNVEVDNRLHSIQEEAEAYKRALSRVYTIRANTKRLMMEEDNAFLIGEDLIQEVEDMLIFTNQNLDVKTQAILASVNRSKNLLFIFTVLAPILYVSMALWFYLKFTKPISSLLHATAILKAGDLDHRVEELDDEFGELANSFNDMSSSLKEVMQNMMRAEQMVLMGEMTSRLAHEIKNPITGIKLAVEIVRDEADLTDEFRDLCAKAVEQIKGMEKLMKGLLSFAKPPVPHFEMEDLNELINSTLSTMEMFIKERAGILESAESVRLVKALDQDLPPIMTDATQVQQILLNLMLNAVDAMPEGGTLTVRSSRSPEDDFLRVDIVDTGSGIDTKIADKIFQPFFSTKMKGTGLGLAIVTQLTDLLGGKLRFKSEATVATTFTVCLPVKQLEGAENK